MNLKQIREKKQYRQTDIVDYLKQIEPCMSVPLLSIIEHGVVLTNKETLKALCYFLNMSPSDIYTKEEMNLANCMKHESATQTKKVDRHRNTCRPGCRLSETAYKSLKKAVFDLGYESIQDWFNNMVLKTMLEHERQTRTKIAG
jgi:transcriptional regulator with XRE-family HTH domain